MMKKVGFTLMALVLLLLVVPGVTAQEDLPIVRYVNFRVYDPVYIALEKGFFRDRGIQVEIIGDVLAGPTAIQAVASGSADAGLSSLMAIINANSQGLPIIGTSDIQSAIGDQPLEEYFVLADSDIQSIADLRGKTVAVNLWRSSFHYTILLALEQASIPEEEVNFVLISFDKQEVALETGQVDVIGLMEPYASHARAVYKDRFRVLFTALDVFGEKQFCTHFVNRIWAGYNPDLARAFTDGIVDAILWTEDPANAEEAKAIVSKYTGIDVQYIPDYKFQPNGMVVMEDVEYWLDYMKRRGDVTADWITVDQIATNAYNSRVQD